MKFKEQYTQAVEYLISSNSFIAGKIFSLTIEENNDIDTADTDGVKIRFNTEFFNKLSYKQRITLIAHETLHCLFGHFIRMATIENCDDELFNVAADHAINLLLKQWGFESLPNWLCNSQYKGMSLEDIYKILKKQSKEKQDQQKQQQKASGGDVKKGKGITPQNAKDKLEEANNELKRAVTRQRKVEKGIQQSKSLVEAEKDKKLNQSKDITNSIESELEYIKTTFINWREVVSHFLFTECLSDYDYSTPDITMLDSPFYIPAIASRGFGNINIALDCSMSLSSIAKEVASEAINCLKQIDGGSLDVLFIDTKIKKIHKDIKDPNEIKLINGDYTCFDCLFAKDKEPLDTQGLIFVTDGFVSTNNWVEPPYKVLWILTQRNDYFKPPFGEVIHFH